MHLEPYVARLQRELAVVAAAGGPDAVELADRLTAPLESVTRLVLLEALSTMAGEVTLDLDGRAVVDVRLRGADPEVVVTGVVVTEQADRPHDAAVGASAAPSTIAQRTAALPGDAEASESADAAESGGTARFSLRLPERLKPQLEAAAEAGGVSVNAWLVRTIAAALDAPDHTPAPPARRGGWVR